MTTAVDLVEMPLPAAMKAIRAGLPTRMFEHLAAVLALSADELALKLGVSPRTLRDQKKKQGVLSRDNSEKLMRVARLQHLARKLFTSDKAVAQWMTTPAPALDGQAPLDLLDTELGAREVEAVLQGLAYGNVL